MSTQFWITLSISSSLVESMIMNTLTATATAHPNIAFIKYWGNRDDTLRLPQNNSISMNLEDLYTRTQVTFDLLSTQDYFSLNGQPAAPNALERVTRFLDLVRQMAGKPWFAQVTSYNNFPMGAGIASSASAFAALSLAASRAIGLQLSECELSRLARRGSGSACRSIPGGFVEWQAGEGDADSYAFSIAPAEHWKLVDCIALVQVTHKPIGSTEGHSLAGSSPLQVARIADSPRRLMICRQAILGKDIESLAQVVELESNLMHAVMMTSKPPLFYWEPASLTIMKSVIHWRNQGVECCYSLDAGPNVHVICTTSSAELVKTHLLQIPDVNQVLMATPGGPAHLEQA